MLVSYGNYTFRLGIPKLATRMDAITNEAKYPVAMQWRADISGKLISQQTDTADAQASIDQQVKALTQAFGTNGGDLILSLDNGSAAATSLANGNTLGGIRVVSGPSFPEGSGAEGVTYRTFSVGLEAEIPLVGPSTLWSFKESLSFEGGGPETDWIECVEGQPVQQTLKQYTAYKLTQTGQATGYLRYWDGGFSDSGTMFRGPLFPAYELRSQRFEMLDGAEAIGGGGNLAYQKFPSRWTYKHKSNLPFTGAVATPWPSANS